VVKQYSQYIEVFFVTFVLATLVSMSIPAMERASAGHYSYDIALRIDSPDLDEAAEARHIVLRSRRQADEYLGAIREHSAGPVFEGLHPVGIGEQTIEFEARSTTCHGRWGCEKSYHQDRFVLICVKLPDGTHAFALQELPELRRFIDKRIEIPVTLTEER